MLALDLEIYNNAGNSLDLSLPVLERAMFHSDNVYEIPNVRIMGNVCFTNFPSNTAFRGFGGPQGMLITENWIQRVAVEVRKSPEEIRVSYMSSLIYFSCQVTVFIQYIIFFADLSFCFLIDVIFRKLIFKVKDQFCIMVNNFNIALCSRFGMNWNYPVTSWMLAKKLTTLI